LLGSGYGEVTSELIAVSEIEINSNVISIITPFTLP